MEGLCCLGQLYGRGQLSSRAPLPMRPGCSNSVLKEANGMLIAACLHCQVKGPQNGTTRIPPFHCIMQSLNINNT